MNDSEMAPGVGAPDILTELTEPRQPVEVVVVETDPTTRTLLVEFSPPTITPVTYEDVVSLCKSGPSLLDLAELEQLPPERRLAELANRFYKTAKAVAKTPDGVLRDNLNRPIGHTKLEQKGDFEQLTYSALSAPASIILLTKRGDEEPCAFRLRFPSKTEDGQTTARLDWRHARPGRRGGRAVSRKPRMRSVGEKSWLDGPELEKAQGVAETAIRFFLRSDWGDDPAKLEDPNVPEKQITAEPQGRRKAKIIPVTVAFFLGAQMLACGASSPAAPDVPAAPAAPASAPVLDALERADQNLRDTVVEGANLTVEIVEDADEGMQAIYKSFGPLREAVQEAVKDSGVEGGWTILTESDIWLEALSDKIKEEIKDVFGDDPEAAVDFIDGYVDPVTGTFKDTEAFQELQRRIQEELDKKLGN